MTTTRPAPAVQRSKIPAKSVALPVEHGAWGFLFEPLLAGVILAPSPAAFFITLFVVGAFLMRQPLKFYLGDRLARKTLPRTGLARRFVRIFGAITGVGLLGTLLFAPLPSLLPFAAAAPIVVYLISQDLARQSRELVPELLAAAALASSIAVVTLAGGIAPIQAFAFWSLMVARLIPSVLYVRSRLRLEKGKHYNPLASTVTHIVAVGLVAALYTYGLSSILTIWFSVFLAGRAIYGLSGFEPSRTAKKLGVLEVVYGVIYALTLVIGYYTGI
jgi:hypothetical protein